VVPNAAVATMLMERGYEGWIALETMTRADVSPVDAVALEMPVLQSWFAG